MNDADYENRVEIGTMDSDLSEVMEGTGIEQEIAAGIVAKYVHDKDMVRIGYLIQRLCVHEPIYRAIFDMVNRVKTYQVPTMGVTIRNGSAYLYFNPKFLNSLTTDEAIDVLRHEALHLIFEHVSTRSFKNCGLPHRMVNIAMDLVINSYLDNLPRGGWKPKHTMWKQTKDGWEKDQEITSFLMSLEEKMDTEYYLAQLRKAAEENESVANQINPPQQGAGQPSQGQPGQGQPGQGQPGQGQPSQGQPGQGQPGQGQPGQGEGNEDGQGDENGEGQGNGNGDEEDGGFGNLPDGMDEAHADNSGVHGGWNSDEVDEQQQGENEAFGNRVKDSLERAVARANSGANGQGWGNTPAALQKFIQELLTRTIPWQLILKRFLANSKRADNLRTIMRPNRRYRNLFPGTRLNYKPVINVYIDQSGSVGDEMLARFFGELGGLAKETEFRCYYFDTEVDEDSMQVWKRGAEPIIARTRCGGTDFEAPTQHALNNTCDGFIILTDGEAPRPSDTMPRKRRCWIIGEGRKLIFDPHPNDVVINLDELKWDKMRKAGANV